MFNSEWSLKYMFNNDFCWVELKVHAHLCFDYL